MTTTAPAPPGTSGTPALERMLNTRPIPVRKPHVRITDFEGDRWPVPDDPIFSHFIATISAVFPKVEEFFVATVRAHADAVPAGSPLKQQIKGFIGQEAMHGREHRAVNRRLDELGYDTEYVSKGLETLTARLLTLKPELLQLAVTASAEHFTIIFAKAVLSDETTRNTLLAHPEVALLGCWHALEELEHKHVAFEVLEHAGGGYFTRALGMVVTLTVIGGYVMKCWIRAVHRDRAHMTPARYRRFLHNLQRQLLLSPWALRYTLAYFRPDFHPDDMDTDALMKEWAERLADKTTLLTGSGARDHGSV